MFCPECQAEYRAEITRCPVCDVDLVERLEEASHVAPKMVVVFETDELPELMAARSALAAAGIPYQSPDQSSVPGTGLGALDPAGQPGHITVPEDRADEAREVLSEAAQVAEPAATDQEE